MKNFKPSFKLQGEVALISIHPIHVEKIVAGLKNLEFRRVWPERAIEALVVYATHPEKRLAAVVEVAGVVRGSKTALWRIAAHEGGGITRQALSAYMQGKSSGVAIRLGQRQVLERNVAARDVFGASFRPPQSFRYLSDSEKVKIRELLGARR